MNKKHHPVLLEEIIKFFQETKITFFFDGTLGAGGHAKKILQQHPEIELYIGCDRDPIAIDIAKKNLSFWSHKLKFVNENFSSIKTVLKKNKIKGIDGCLFDLGISSMQIDEKERGFSFLKEGRLDMRMDPSLSLTAEEVVNHFSLKELEKIFKELGEEPHFRKAAKIIVEKRKKEPIKTTTQLASLLVKGLGRIKGKSIHRATLVFQALRIYVNQELEGIKKAVNEAVDVLNPSGRIGVISFHSLEDRIVKNIFREESKKQPLIGPGIERKKKRLILLTKKPVISEKEEIIKNQRARSAKLRFAQKI